MGVRARWRLGFSLACGVLLGGYLVWLLPLVAHDAPGTWRALVTCLGTALLIRQVPGVETAAVLAQEADRRDRTVALAAVTLAGVAWAWAFANAWVWAAWLPGLAMAARLGLHGRRALLRRPLLGLMAAAAFPYEALLPEAVDGGLQRVTAQAATGLVNLTGLPVSLQTAPPALLGPNDLVVSVTALCAGAPTLIALVTLGLLLAELAFDTLATQALCVMMAPAFGIAGNVLRVALSTHAANLWAGDGLAWPVAHDVIGYLTFGLAYLGLFACVRALRQWRPRATAPAMSNSASGHSVASP